MVKDKSIYNIPNSLSFYRIVSFPIVLYFVIINKELIFFILMLINLLTDILDGYIARKFNMQTEFGAKLDAFADIGMYILAIIGVVYFKGTEFIPHLSSFSIFIFVFILPKVIAYLRFHSFPSLHLYSSKIGGYLQGFFFLYLFVLGFSSYFYYFMISFGIVSFVEQSIILLVVSKLESNVKGLYWVLKK